MWQQPRIIYTMKYFFYVQPPVVYIVICVNNKGSLHKVNQYILISNWCGQQKYYLRLNVFVTNRAVLTNNTESECQY